MQEPVSEPTSRKNHPRRAVTLLAAALLIPPALAASLLSFDLGSVMLVRTQLQVAADASSLAAAAAMGSPREGMEDAARRCAIRPEAGGGSCRVELASSDIEYGVWDESLRMFTASAAPSNAIRVTARAPRDNLSAAPLIFPTILGNAPFAGVASAVAEVAPREICFVVDLSGSSNDDTEPCWAADAINARCASTGYPALGDQLMQKVYDDFGFGPYPGEQQRIGERWGIDPQTDPLAELAKPDGPLASQSVAVRYRILSGDDQAVRHEKACRAVIEQQIAQCMPLALPAAGEAANFAWWQSYLDYVAASPKNPGAERIDRFNNPDHRKWPSSVHLDDRSRGYVGYKTYVQFLMDLGRDRLSASRYSPLSRYSPDCPWHEEKTAAGIFRFPPREQPLHGVRLALIAAIERFKNHNSRIVDKSLCDRVSIVAFDSLAGGGPQIVQPLSSDYDAAMQTCASLQAASDAGEANATEAGLVAAHQHLRRAHDGGAGRDGTQRIVVLLTDGAPRLYLSDPAAIAQLAAESPQAAEFSPDGDYARDAVLVKIDEMRSRKYRVYAVGIGIARDQAFLDAMARVAGSASAQGSAGRPAGDPSDCTPAVLGVVEEILANPQVRLVN